MTPDVTRLYNEDCISGARNHLSDNSVDLIITDPPYGIQGDTLHKHYNRDERNVIDGYVEVPRAKYGDFSREWIFQAERVLKPGGTLYVVSGWTNLRHILNALSETKLEEVNHIIWKYNFGVYTSRKYISSHYHILYYVKPGGKPTFNTYAFFSDSEKTAEGGSLNYLDREDVWVINREYKPGQIKNKNELPTALLYKMILYSSNPGDRVCDFFLGGFSTAKCALELGRQVCGFEINKNAFDHKLSSLRSIVSGGALENLRTPPPNHVVNRGKTLTVDEKKAITRDFSTLRREGYTKKSSIEKIGERYGRGYWSILRIIDGNENRVELFPQFSADLAEREQSTYPRPKGRGMLDAQEELDSGVHTELRFAKHFSP